MNAHNVSYTGCDWNMVCNKHKAKLKEKGIEADKLNFVTNSRGNYTWTLFELIEARRLFDVIYLDGSHTFYVDCPAAILAHHLLKSGGMLVLDDISWNLKDLASNMRRNFHEWYFYRRMYRFEEYTEEQQKKCHIRMIAEELMIKRLKYRKIEKYSIGDSVWTLEKLHADN